MRRGQVTAQPTAGVPAAASRARATRSHALVSPTAKTSATLANITNHPGIGSSSPKPRKFSLKAAEKPLISLSDDHDVFVMNMMPPVILTVLKNEKGQRIIEVCIWLQAGLSMDDLSVFVMDDMKTLKYQVRMDPLMANGVGLHQDLVPLQGNKKPSKQDCRNHIRVHHWNSMIDEMSTGNGLLPRYAAEIPLPEEVCSRKLLRRAGKESEKGTRVVLIDLLVEDSRLPRIEKRTFEMITDDASTSDDIVEINGSDCE